jgi:hypothetical protein
VPVVASLPQRLVLLDLEAALASPQVAGFGAPTLSGPSPRRKQALRGRFWPQMARLS